MGLMVIRVIMGAIGVVVELQHQINCNKLGYLLPHKISTERSFLTRSREQVSVMLDKRTSQIWPPNHCR
jgi:hypothetical protein